MGRAGRVAQDGGQLTPGQLHKGGKKTTIIVRVSGLRHDPRRQATLRPDAVQGTAQSVRRRSAIPHLSCHEGSMERPCGLGSRRSRRNVNDGGRGGISGLCGTGGFCRPRLAHVRVHFVRITPIHRAKNRRLVLPMIWNTGGWARATAETPAARDGAMKMDPGPGELHGVPKVVPARSSERGLWCGRRGSDFHSNAVRGPGTRGLIVIAARDQP